MAEGTGFEPARAYALTIFKTASLNRSDTPPFAETKMPFLPGFYEYTKIVVVCQANMIHGDMIRRAFTY